MSDPRASVNFTGIGYLAATFVIDNSTITYSATVANGSAAVGKAVTLSAAKTVALAGDGVGVLGKLIQVEPDLVALVQIEGFCTLPGGNGASLSLNKMIVGAADAGANPGFIREAASGTAAELVLQNGRIIDAGTATAVWVKF